VIPTVTKISAYKILSRNTVTTTASYQIFGGVLTVQRTATYKIYRVDLPATLTKSAGYKIQTGGVITKTAQYTVFNSVTVTVTAPTTHRIVKTFIATPTGDVRIR
jgi:hypothetical protein